ncbi:hypothetical protein MBANPS3_004934 [Mucor bainieri]
MSTQTKSLPIEIWLHTFNILESDKTTLATCRRVCKAWKPLVERVLYKEITLCLLVQKLTFIGLAEIDSRVTNILKRTPNLKIIAGTCKDGSFKKLLSPELANLKLQEILRCEKYDIPLYSKVLLCYKDTLKSVDIGLTEDMDPSHLALLLNTISQCKKITKLTIRDIKHFQSIKQLETILKLCKHTKELRLKIDQSPSYSHMDQSGLKEWLVSNAEKLNTVKKLEIQYNDEGLSTATLEQSREFEPDWVEYLNFKCPELENLRIVSDYDNRPQIIQPMFEHLNTFGMHGLKFSDAGALTYFVTTIKSTNVHIELVASNGRKGWLPFICKMDAIKEARTKYTSFEISIINDKHFTTNLKTVLSAFSTKTIKHQTITLEGKHDCTLLLSRLSNANFKVKSLNMTATQLRINQDQPVLAEDLRELKLSNSVIDVKYIKQLCGIAPNLTHLTLSNCSLVDLDLKPSSQLTMISIIADKVGHGSLQKHYNCLLFHVSLTTSATTHFFIAAKNKPLQIITRQEYEASSEHVVRIKCGTLQHLHVNNRDVNFHLEFDVEQGHIKSANIGIQDSFYLALKKKYTSLEQDHELLKQKYLKLKKTLLSLAQIESIKKD